MIPPRRVALLLEPFGQLTPQNALDWAGSFVLPPEINAFYREVGPLDLDVPGYGNNYFMPRLADLWRYQVGYRFDGRNGDRLQDCKRTGSTAEQSRHRTNSAPVCPARGAATGGGSLRIAIRTRRATHHCAHYLAPARAALRL